MLVQVKGPRLSTEMYGSSTAMAPVTTATAATLAAGRKTAGGKRSQNCLINGGR